MIISSAKAVDTACAVGTVMFALSASLAAEKTDPKVEAICRGIERRLVVMKTYSVHVAEREFIPPRRLEQHRSAARAWGEPGTLGFHPDELTERSLSLVSLWWMPDQWRLEKVLCVFDGVNLWDMYRRTGRVGKGRPGYDYHTVEACDGVRLARWTDRDNSVALQPYQSKLTGQFNRLETAIIQTGLFDCEYLRKPQIAPSLRLVGQEALPDGDCVILQSKASATARVHNANCYDRIWVAPERSFAILRWEVVELERRSKGSDGGSAASGLKLPAGWEAGLLYAYVASDLREVVPGFWLPWRAKSQTLALPQQGQPQAWEIRSFQVRELAVDRRSPPLLALVPLGAEMNDFFEKRGYPNGWEQGEIEKFLTEPRPEPEQIRPVATLTGEHAPTEP